MKMKIVYTFQAQQDLKNIYEYISDSLLAPDIARSMYQKIIQSARSVSYTHLDVYKRQAVSCGWPRCPPHP